MRKLLLRNRDSSGPVLIDLRLTHGYVPFNELATVPGFPRILDHEEIVEIDVADFKEALYTRSLSRETELNYALYRIELPKDVDEKIAFIWPTH